MQSQLIDKLKHELEEAKNKNMELIQ